MEPAAGSPRVAREFALRRAPCGADVNQIPIAKPITRPGIPKDTWPAMAINRTIKMTPMILRGSTATSQFDRFPERIARLLAAGQSDISASMVKYAETAGQNGRPLSRRQGEGGRAAPASLRRHGATATGVSALRRTISGVFVRCRRNLPATTIGIIKDSVISRPKTTTVYTRHTKGNRKADMTTAGGGRATRTVFDEIFVNIDKING